MFFMACDSIWLLMIIVNFVMYLHCITSTVWLHFIKSYIIHLWTVLSSSRNLINHTWQILCKKRLQPNALYFMSLTLHQTLCSSHSASNVGNFCFDWHINISCTMTIIHSGLKVSKFNGASIGNNICESCEGWCHVIPKGQGRCIRSLMSQNPCTFDFWIFEHTEQLFYGTIYAHTWL